MSARLAVHLRALAEVLRQYPAPGTRSNRRPRSAEPLRYRSVAKYLHLGIDGVTSGVTAATSGLGGGSPSAEAVSAEQELPSYGLRAEEAAESRMFRICGRATEMGRLVKISANRRELE